MHFSYCAEKLCLEMQDLCTMRLESSGKFCISACYHTTAMEKGSVCQHVSAFVSVCQRVSACVSVCHWVTVCFLVSEMSQVTLLLATVLSVFELSLECRQKLSLFGLTIYMRHTLRTIRIFPQSFTVYKRQNLMQTMFHGTVFGSPNFNI